MKHANIEDAPEGISLAKHVEAETADGKKIRMVERKYTKEETDEFESEKSKWIVECKGSRQFLAESDSGEDAYGYYCGYFDLDPERAVFENGRLVGFYLYTDGMRYSGRGRYNFDIDRWGYPGYDLFRSSEWKDNAHLFLFQDPQTHHWKDWSLLEREPGKEYKSYLDF